MEKPAFSEEYLRFVEWSKETNELKPLTNSQHKLAELLLDEENKKLVSQIGDMEYVFNNVRKYLKSNYESKSKTI